MLGFHQKKNALDSGTEERPRPLSRREFLGSVASAAALISVTKAKAESVLRGSESKESWQVAREEGIADLKIAALTKENEQVSFFVREGDRGRWIQFGETGGDTYAQIPLADLESTLQNPDVTVEIFHTHPLHTIMRERGVVITDSVKPDPTPMPPSSQDILSIVVIRGLLKEKGDRFSESVVDPIGTWSYAVDMKNPLMQELKKAIDAVQDFSEHVSSEVLQEARDFAKQKGTDGGDPRLVGMMLLQNVDSLSPNLQQAVREITRDFSVLMESRTMQKFLLASDSAFCTSDLMKASERADLIETYRRAGVPLSFTVHPEPASAVVQ